MSFHLITLVIKKLEKELADLEQGLSHTLETAKDAPHAMESRYDTMRNEMQNLAAGLQQKVEELKSQISTLEKATSINPSQKEKISVGHLIELQESNKKFLYFLLPVGSGIKIHKKNREIVIIAPETPLGSSLLGKNKGDVIAFNNRTLKITNLE